MLLLSILECECLQFDGSSNWNWGSGWLYQSVSGGNNDDDSDNANSSQQIMPSLAAYSINCSV